VCTFDIVVTDNESPVITCPSDIAVNTDAGDCEAVVTFSASATDNCSSIITYSHASGSAFPVGTTTVTATATDPAGNTDVCTFTRLDDNEDPIITCP
jgi:phage tail sheath gpL-like